jgi:hypothetical protein
MQPVQSLFLRRRFILRGTALPRRIAASNWRPAREATQRILCLRPPCQLSAENAVALTEAVAARVRAAVPPPHLVVLDVSATSAFGEGVAAALQVLGTMLSESQASLRLVLPEAKARAAFFDASAGKAVEPDMVHTGVRAAVLAAFASLPGPALVTPALSELLDQPPEVLPLPSPPQ